MWIDRARSQTSQNHLIPQALSQKDQGPQEKELNRGTDFPLPSTRDMAPHPIFSDSSSSRNQPLTIDLEERRPCLRRLPFSLIGKGYGNALLFSWSSAGAPGQARKDPYPRMLGDRTRIYTTPIPSPPIFQILCIVYSTLSLSFSGYSLWRDISVEGAFELSFRTESVG